MEGEDADRVEQIRVVRTAGEQRFVLLARLGDPLVRHQRPRIGETAVARARVLVDELAEALRRVCGRFLLQKLRFEDRWAFPVGLELGGAARFGKRE